MALSPVFRGLRDAGATERTMFMRNALRSPRYGVEYGGNTCLVLLISFAFAVICPLIPLFGALVQAAGHPGTRQHDLFMQLCALWKRWTHLAGAQHQHPELLRLSGWHKLCMHARVTGGIFPRRRGVLRGLLDLLEVRCDQGWDGSTEACCGWPLGPTVHPVLPGCRYHPCHRYQLIYNYQRKYESGGQFFPFLAER